MSRPETIETQLYRSPCCLAHLAAGEELLTCVGCGTSYPIDKGIPVLLPHAAIKPKSKP